MHTTGVLAVSEMTLHVPTTGVLAVRLHVPTTGVLAVSEMTLHVSTTGVL